MNKTASHNPRLAHTAASLSAHVDASMQAGGRAYHHQATLIHDQGQPASQGTAEKPQPQILADAELAAVAGGGFTATVPQV